MEFQKDLMGRSLQVVNVLLIQLLALKHCGSQ